MHFGTFLGLIWVFIGLGYLRGFWLVESWLADYSPSNVSHSDWLLDQVGLLVNGYHVDGCCNLDFDWMVLVWSSLNVVLSCLWHRVWCCNHILLNVWSPKYVECCLSDGLYHLWCVWVRWIGWTWRVRRYMVSWWSHLYCLTQPRGVTGRLHAFGKWVSPRGVKVRVTV